MKNVKNVLKGLLVGMVVVVGCMVNGVTAKADVSPVIDSNIVDHYTLQNGDVKTVYSNGSYYLNSDVQVQSIDKINNTVTFNKDSQLYSFYVDKDSIDNYYMNESINVTMDNNNEVVDCIIDTQPIVYSNVSISKVDTELVYVNINGDLYAFDNEDGLEDGWKVNDKCNVVMQNDTILEVRPYVNK